MYLSVDGQELPGEDPNAFGAVLPGDVVDLPMPLAADRFTAGAFVQAREVIRSTDPDVPDAVRVTEFIAMKVVGDVVTSPFGKLDGLNGVIFDVIRPATVELPAEERATITAELTDGTVVTLTGKNRLWMNDDGDLIDPDSIRSFTLADGS